MNFMGIGIMELGVILLVGFLVLGPGRSIDMARRTAKVLGDLRRTFNEVTEAISTEERARGQGEQQPASTAPGVPTRPDFPDQSPAGENPPSGEPPQPPQDGGNSGRA
jgi:Sec-independent protein translocase protein TatA